MTLYIKLTHQHHWHSSQDIGDQGKIRLDFDPEGNLIGIEILSAVQEIRVGGQILPIVQSGAVS